MLPSFVTRYNLVAQFVGFCPNRYLDFAHFKLRNTPCQQDGQDLNAGVK